MALTEKLTNIADAIRGKTGGTEEMTLDQMAVAISGIATGGGMPEGMNAFILTLDTAYPTSAEGWTLVIPHGLGVAPKFAIVQNIKGIPFASKARGWVGNAYEGSPENMFYTGNSGNRREGISIQDEAAQNLRVDAENLYCTANSWGGGLAVGDMLFVGVLA